MALNLEALKRKLDQLNGTAKGGGNRNENLWKPELGDHRARIVPWTDNEGQPFKERYFYYNIGSNPGFLALNQFGKPDPIQELINKLRNTGDPKDKEFCKRLYPKMRCYVPVIVRGEEDKGVRLWAFGKMIYQDLIGIFTDADFGDISDPTDGFDIKIKIAPSPKKSADGRSYNDTKVSCAPKSTKLCDDSKQAQEWLKNIPNLEEMFTLKTYVEIKAMVDSWLEAGAPGDAPKNEAAATEEATASEPGDSPVPNLAQKTGKGNKKKDLDKAFDELMSTDETA